MVGMVMNACVRHAALNSAQLCRNMANFHAVYMNLGVLLLECRACNHRAALARELRDPGVNERCYGEADLPERAIRSDSTSSAMVRPVLGIT